MLLWKCYLSRVSSSLGGRNLFVCSSYQGRIQWGHLYHERNSAEHGLHEEETLLIAEREAADDHLVKKMQLTKGIDLKRKENEWQHVFYEEVKDMHTQDCDAYEGIECNSTCSGYGKRGVKGRWEVN